MKIGIPSTEPDLDGIVENRLGLADHLLVVETDDMSFDVLKGPSDLSGSGAGVQAVSLIVGMGAKVILVGYISPYISNALAKQGIEVVTHVSGSVLNAVKSYINSKNLDAGCEKKAVLAGKFTAKSQWLQAVSTGLNQLRSFLPRLVGVILLLGLFQGFVSQQKLLSLFSGSALQDSFWGACIGSFLAGNPVNSYVIGKSFLSIGVGLYGATALMLAWVNVGLIQLPLEGKALGMRFALIRNISGFVMAVTMSFVVVGLHG